MSVLEPEHDRDLVDVIGESVSLLCRFAIPLYREVRRVPILRGTGFFVRSGDAHFLVTAAHVFDGVSPHELFFYCTPQLQRWLTGRLLVSGQEKRRDDDLVDIAVMQLAELPQPPFLEVQKFAMDISYLQPGYLPRTGKHYAIAGFPETKNRASRIVKSIDAAPYAYRSDSVPEEIYARLGRQVHSHILLPLDLRQGFGPDGKSVHFPKPQGMSGSPIFVLYEPDDSDHSRVFPVVGVGTRYSKSKKVLYGTDVRYVLEAIKRFS